MSSYFLDPAQEWFLSMSRAKAAMDQELFESMASDPQLQGAMLAYSTTHPAGSTELGLALAQGGIPAGDPMAMMAVNDEIAARDTIGSIEKQGGGWWNNATGVFDEWVTNPIQGTVRWTFSAWDAAYQMVAGGAPIRSRELARQEGIGFGEAWREQDPYFFEALGGIFEGENVNLGSGWFPNSDVTDEVSASVNEQMMQLERETQDLPTNEMYSTRLEGAPDIWRRAVEVGGEAQAELGRPIVQQNMADVESVIFEINPVLSNGPTRYTPWSPGRIAAANVYEPGTEAFSRLSGAGDFAAQIFADPVDYLGMAWMKAGRNSRKIWGEGQVVATEVVDKAATEVKFASGAEAAGRVLEAPRTPVLPGAVSDEAIDAVNGSLVHVGSQPEVPSGINRYEPSYGVGDRIVDRTPEISATPYQPPKWIQDKINYMTNMAQGRWRAGIGSQPKPQRVAAGHYEMEMPKLPGQVSGKATVRRVGEGRGAHWEIALPDGQLLGKPVADPRFEAADTKFRTMKEAQERLDEFAASDEALGTQRFFGMSSDEFVASAEDFAVDDFAGIMNATYAAAKGLPEGRGVVHRVAHAGTKTKRKAFQNARVRVFGRTMDVSSGKTDDLPEGLVAALGRDGKLRGNNIIGFGDPNIEAFTNTQKWMEANGYGKLKWDDDTTIISDSFIGGSGTSPEGNSRFWFDSGDKPMFQYADDVSTATPDEVNEILDLMGTAGRVADDLPVAGDVTKMTAPESVIAAREAGTGIPVSAGDEALSGVDELGFEIPSMGRAVGRPTPGIDPRLARTEIDPAKRAATAEKLSTSSAPEAQATFRGVRNDVDPSFQLHGKKADMFLDKLVAVSREGGAKNIAMLDNLVEFFGKQGTPMPVKVRTALYEANSKNEVREIFVKWLVTEGGQEAILPGGTKYGRLSTLTGGPSTEVTNYPSFKLSDRSGFARRFSKALPHKEELNFVEDPSAAYELVRTALPHYNLQRGGKVDMFNPKTGARMEGTMDVEDLLERIRVMQPGMKSEAFEIMGDMSKMFFSQLVGDGVSPQLASDVSRWWKGNLEMANFSSSRFGKVKLSDEGVDLVVINDELVAGLGPQLDADLWSGAISLPTPRELKRVANESDLLGKIANSIAAKKVVGREATDEVIGSMKFEDRVSMQVANFAMNKVWKPFVLLRGAWTLRILMDDQARMLADGYSTFNHPARIFNYALTRPEDWKDAFMKGRVDVFGESMTVGNIDELKHGEIFRDSMMRMWDDEQNVGTYGARHFEDVVRGHPRYAEGMVFEITRLSGSPLTKRLAGSKGDGVEETVRWLMGKGKKGSPDPAREIASLVDLHGSTPDVAKRILELDEQTLRNVVSKQNALLHHRLGGDVVLDTGTGKLISMDRLAVMDETVGVSGTPQWVVRQDGDSDLLKVVSGDKSVVGDIGAKGAPGTAGMPSQNAALKKLEGVVRQKVDASDLYPNSVRGPMDIAETGAQKNLGETLNDAVGKAFEILMTQPSNRLSRSPEFRAAYWERMARFYPYMDNTLRSKIDDMAPTKIKAELRKSRSPRDADIRGQVTDLDQVDAQAKAYALTRVEQTLFTLQSKRNISDSLNLIFPFVEAWGEFITRWGRIMVTGDSNIHVARRFQQSVQGARGSGFFHENEYGQEVFNYPSFLTKAGVEIHNKVNNLPVVDRILGGDVSPEVAESIQATGSVESLNFASGVIPGFGPVMQFASQQILPDSPEWDWVREVISPFGTTGGAINQLSPAWVKRLMSANGTVNDPALEYTYNSSVMDVLRTKIDNGDFAGVTSTEEMNTLLQEAKDEAKGLLMVRSAATFFEPSAPTYTFQKEDTNGMVWSYNNLGQAFREIQEEEAGGDAAAAYDIFYQRFGFLPHAFRGGRTYSTVDRSLTEAGGKFERSNFDLFNKYPSIAMFLDPTIAAESEYNHSAMIDQLNQGLREFWTGDQFLLKQQDQLGDIWWDHENKIAAAMGSGQKKGYLAQRHVEIQSKYPAWNQPIPGKAARVPAEQQRSEMTEAINDTSLAGEPVVDAARIYDQERNRILATLATYGASTIDGPSSETTLAGQTATLGREHLRQLAEELVLEYPEFKPLYDSVYAYEVDGSHDAVEPLTLDMFGEGDPFIEMGIEA